jgi:hypothetical protein
MILYTLNPKPQPSWESLEECERLRLESEVIFVVLPLEIAAWLEAGSALLATETNPARHAQLATAVSQARFYAGGLVK